MGKVTEFILFVRKNYVQMVNDKINAAPVSKLSDISTLREKLNKKEVTKESLQELIARCGEGVSATESRTLPEFIRSAIKDLSKITMSDELKGDHKSPNYDPRLVIIGSILHTVNSMAKTHSRFVRNLAKEANDLISDWTPGDVSNALTADVQYRADMNFDYGYQDSVYKADLTATEQETLDEELKEDENEEQFYIDGNRGLIVEGEQYQGGRGSPTPEVKNDLDSMINGLDTSDDIKTFLKQRFHLSGIAQSSLPMLFAEKFGTMAFTQHQNVSWSLKNGEDGKVLADFTHFYREFKSPEMKSSSQMPIAKIHRTVEFSLGKGGQVEANVLESNLTIYSQDVADKLRTLNPDYYNEIQAPVARLTS